MSVHLLRDSLYRVASTLGIGAYTEVNEWLGLEDAREARELLKFHQYYRLQRLVERLRDSHPGRYGLVIAALADWSGRPEWLDGWVWYASHLPESWMVRGAHAVSWAFQVHQPGFRQPQGMLAMHTFFKRLEQAEEDLGKAVELAPGNPEPYAWRIASGGALGCSRKELEQRFQALTRCAPEHFQGHSNLLIALYRRPESSDNELFSFARRLSDQAPPGSLLHALIAQAHVERWAMQVFSEGPESASTAIRQPQVDAELRAAWQRLFGAADYRPDVLEPVVAGYFAVAFYLAQDRQGVADAMKPIGQYAVSYPWSHLCRTSRECLHPGFAIDRVRDYPRQMVF